jgi:hypothetical protein
MAPLPTAALIEPEPLANHRASSPHARNPTYSPYFCVAGRLIPGKEAVFAYGARRVRFAPTELADDGTSQVYAVRSYVGEGRLSASARCMIPNTPAAKHRINRIFHVPEAGSRSADGNIPMSSVVPIEGVVGEACRYGGDYPHCNYEPTWGDTRDIECSAVDPYCTGGGDSGGDWSWGGGGGGDPLPPPPEDLRPECSRDAQGNCVLHPPSDAEWRRIGELVNRMTEGSEYCRGAKAIANEMYGRGLAAGRFKLWYNRDTFINEDGEEDMRWGANTSDAGGRILAFDSYVLFNTRSLFAHEALHAYLNSINSPLMGRANEDWVAAHEVECAG